jgi:hypothetical protein
MATPSLRLDALREWTRVESLIAAEPAPPGPPGAPISPRSLASRVRALGASAALYLLFALLPFLALVRVAVFLYLRHGFPGWVAALAGVGSAIGLIAVYGAWWSRRLTGRLHLAWTRRVALALVLPFAGSALLYVSSAHAKSEHVRTYYTALHPLLRLALSTLILADRDLVMTDLARRPEDYRAMRLPVYDGSLHYVQADGYVHAADLRTLGRGVVRNGLVQLYFQAMGFQTLRHVGTAEHLHVELALR